MSGILSVAYGLLAYAVFLISFLYAIGFTGNFIVPKSIDSGVPGSFGVSLLINLVLLGLFAVQHTVMARPAFKRWITRYMPEHLERSTFVLAASLLLLLLYWQWKPMPGIVWNVGNPVGEALLWGIFAFGWLMVLSSTFLINHFDLFGLRQVYLHQRGADYNHLKFTTTGLYKVVRHPIMLGFIIAFWSTPYMTVGHLLFAIGTTGYILIGLQFEEHDLRHFLGEDYEQYRAEVPMICPFSKRHAKKTLSPET